MKIETFSHYQNILSNIEGLPVYSALDPEVNFYIAGGYALALIFAPRNETLMIDNNYYDDIDIYFEKQEELEASIKRIKIQKEIKIIEENEKWFVFELPTSENVSYTFQFMKKLFNTSPSFFMEYDILNCCVAFSSKKNEFYYKTNAIEATVAQVVEHNKDFRYGDNELKAITFAYRLNKYLARYKMKLSQSLHSKLLYSLIQNKGYKTTKQHDFRISWSTNEMETVPEGFNIWKLYRYAFATNPKHVKYIAKFFQEELQ